MRLLVKASGFMAVMSALAIPLALFSDTSTGDTAYSVTDAFLATVIFSAIYLFAKRWTR